MTISGDLRNSLDALKRELRRLKPTNEIDYQSLLVGTPTVYVGLYTYILCDHNTSLTKDLLQRGFQVTGLSDYKLMECLYKIMRDLFAYKPQLTLTQFFTNGFPERKMYMARDIVARIMLHMESLIKSGGPPKGAASIASKTRNRRKVQRQDPTASDDGIEIHEYNDFSLPTRVHSSKSRSSTSFTSHSKADSAPFASSKKPPSYRRSKPHIIRTGSKNEGYASDGDTRSKIPSVTRCRRGSDSDSRTRSSSQLNILSHILDDKSKPPQAPGHHKLNGHSSERDETPRTPMGMLDTSVPKGDSDANLVNTMHKISTQLDMIVNRITSIESRLQHVENKVSLNPKFEKSPMNSSIPESTYIPTYTSTNLTKSSLNHHMKPSLGTTLPLYNGSISSSLSAKNVVSAWPDTKHGYNGTLSKPLYEQPTTLSSYTGANRYGTDAYDQPIKSSSAGAKDPLFLEFTYHRTAGPVTSSAIGGSSLIGNNYKSDSSSFDRKGDTASYNYKKDFGNDKLPKYTSDYTAPVNDFGHDPKTSYSSPMYGFDSYQGTSSSSAYDTNPSTSLYNYTYKPNPSSSAMPLPPSSTGHNYHPDSKSGNGTSSQQHYSREADPLSSVSGHYVSQSPTSDNSEPEARDYKAVSLHKSIASASTDEKENHFNDAPPTYRNQADRIASILADTQGLLTHH